jgi:hypothetical protein
VGGARYFSEKKMSELWENGPEPGPVAEERARELKLVAQHAIDARLELADRLEAA